MKWTRLLSATVCLLLSSASIGFAAGAVKTNIVLILVDDMGWADAGCNGSTFYRTPQIDRLAKEGVLFTDAYAAGPVCSPTRASILTGKHPARLHLTDWLPGRQDRPSQKLLKPETERRLPLEQTTIAEALKPAGYVSASIGKWHLGGLGYLPQNQGFDVNVAGDDTGTPLAYFAPFEAGLRTMPGLEKSKAGEYLTDRLTDEAERFIESNQNRPFFLYLSHYAVHTPLKAKEAMIEKYRFAAAGSGAQTNAIYAAMIESVDESVGRIVKKLEALNLHDRTVVIFTSDNGGLSVQEGPHTPATSNAPLRAGKGYLYEGGIRVPLIIRGAGVAGGAEIRTPVYSADLFPTILSLAGVALPEGLDGISLWPVLNGKASLGRNQLFWHYPHYSNQGGKPSGAIREGAMKLIEFFENGRLELYDLAADPGETTDLSKAKPEKAAALRDTLAAWRRSQGAQMMEPNPEYIPPKL
jgi:arylsulfatase A